MRYVYVDGKGNEVTDKARSTGCIIHPDDRPVHAGGKKSSEPGESVIDFEEITKPGNGLNGHGQGEP